MMGLGGDSCLFILSCTQDQEKEELAQICDDLMKELRNRE